jgi:hypothetical protein
VNTLAVYGGTARCFQPDLDVQQAEHDARVADSRQQSREAEAHRQRRVAVAAAALPQDVPEHHRRRVAASVVDALDAYTAAYADPWQA